MSLFRTAAVSALAAMTISCCPCRKMGSTISTVKEHTWQLVSLDGQKIEAGDGYFIAFDDEGKVSGRGDCNQLAGTYYMDAGGKLSIKGVTSPRMACPGQANENKFITAMQSADGYAVDRKNMLLMLLRDSQAMIIMEAKR